MFVSENRYQYGKHGNYFTFKGSLIKIMKIFNASMCLLMRIDNQHVNHFTFKGLLIKIMGILNASICLLMRIDTNMGITLCLKDC